VPRKLRNIADSDNVRLAPILERHRKSLAPDISKGFVAEIAKIEESFQFNDNREEPKRRIRKALSIEVQEAQLTAADE